MKNLLLAAACIVAVAVIAIIPYLQSLPVLIGGDTPPESLYRAQAINECNAECGRSCIESAGSGVTEIPWVDIGTVSVSGGGAYSCPDLMPGGCMCRSS